MTTKDLLVTNRRAVTAAFGKTRNDVESDIDIIKKWFKSQQHLPEMPNDNIIETFLVTNKFSIERTKQKMDMYYSVRTLIPEIYANINPRLNHMQEVYAMGYCVPLPRLTKELYRVNVMKLMSAVEIFDTYTFLSHQINILEVRIQEDLVLGDVVIVDLEHLKMGHLPKVYPMHLKNATTILEKVFSNRIKRIHIINYPSYVDALIRICKAVMKPKLFDRIKLDTTYEQLYDYLPRDLLPKDYGGEELSLEELNGDNMIEMFLATNKYSIERTKEKLDMYYTIRALIPELYDHCNLSIPQMIHNDAGIFVPLPKQTKDMYRVSIMKIRGPVEDFDVCQYFAHMLNHMEVRLQHDISKGEVFILDHVELKMGHVLKMTPLHVKRITTVLEKVFSNRMKGMHVINYPPFIDILMTVCKAAFKPKLFARIHLHNNIDELYEHVPKDILPVDYGGEELSVKELNELWNKYLRQHSDRLQFLQEMKVKEELRPAPLDNDELLGYHGNFKKLNVD